MSLKLNYTGVDMVRVLNCEGHGGGLYVSAESWGSTIERSEFRRARKAPAFAMRMIHINPDTALLSWFKRLGYGNMKSRRPDKFLTVLPYGPCEEPPENMKQVPENVAIRLVTVSDCITDVADDAIAIRGNDMHLMGRQLCTCLFGH